MGTTGICDSVCVFCGVSPSGGPQWFSMDEELENDAEKITEAILDSGSDASPEDMQQIVLDAVRATQSHALPEGLGRGQYADTWIAIGYLGETEEWAHGSSTWKIPCGRAVEGRRVRQPDYNFTWFNTRIIVDDNDNEVEVEETTFFDPMQSPSFFICERCYFYLGAWIDLDKLPPRSCGFPEDPEPLEFPDELYEIVNMSWGGKRHWFNCIADTVDYGDVLEFRDDRDYFWPGCWTSPAYLQQAIGQGLRGAQLVPAMMRDLKAWMFMRPDIWPQPPAAISYAGWTEFPLLPQSSIPVIGSLPSKLLLQVFADLPFVSLLALGATCRSLRRLIHHSPFAEELFAECVLRGSLRWILPVEEMPNDEPSRAYATMRSWLPESHRAEARAPDGEADGELASTRPPCLHPHFPRLAFLRACWESDSMMNRKRLWEISRQFKALWIDYRLHGWKDKSMFFDSRELEKYYEDGIRPDHWKVSH